MPEVLWEDHTSDEATKMGRRVCQIPLLVISVMHVDKDPQVVVPRWHFDCSCRKISAAVQYMLDLDALTWSSCKFSTDLYRLLAILLLATTIDTGVGYLIISCRREPLLFTFYVEGRYWRVMWCLLRQKWDQDRLCLCAPSRWASFNIPMTLFGSVSDIRTSNWNSFQAYSEEFAKCGVVWLLIPERQSWTRNTLSCRSRLTLQGFPLMNFYIPRLYGKYRIEL